MASVRPRTDGQILVAAPPFAEDYDKIVVCGNECAAERFCVTIGHDGSGEWSQRTTGSYQRRDGTALAGLAQNF
jgi:hypothetical protein